MAAKYGTLDALTAASFEELCTLEDFGAVTAECVVNWFRLENNLRLCERLKAHGLNTNAVAEKASFITPVPGGVGPMTRAVLMRNVLAAAKDHQK